MTSPTNRVHCPDCDTRMTRVLTDNPRRRPRRLDQLNGVVRFYRCGRGHEYATVELPLALLADQLEGALDA